MAFDEPSCRSQLHAAVGGGAQLHAAALTQGGVFSAPCRRTYAGGRVLLRDHVHRMLIGACNPMLCLSPI